ncbi:MAG: OmpA family protein [Candidatus Thiodiazotropha sp.]
MKKSNKTVVMFCGLFLLSGCANLENRILVKEIEEFEVEVKQIDRGVEIIFPEVLLFEYNSDRLKQEAKTKLHKIAEVINHPQYVSRNIAVEGHADAIGGDDFNLALSKRRAQSVARALVFSGILKERIVIAWFGKSRPIVPNTNPDGSDNPQGRKRNRRVEVIIEN